jgi:hypothetical protein
VGDDDEPEVASLPAFLSERLGTEADDDEQYNAKQGHESCAAMPHAPSLLPDGLGRGSTSSHDITIESIEHVRSVTVR